MFSGDSFLSSGSDRGSQETITVVPVLCLYRDATLQFLATFEVG